MLGQGASSGDVATEATNYGVLEGLWNKQLVVQVHSLEEFMDLLRYIPELRIVVCLER